MLERQIPFMIATTFFITKGPYILPCYRNSSQMKTDQKHELASNEYSAVENLSDLSDNRTFFINVPHNMLECRIKCPTEK